MSIELNHFNVLLVNLIRGFCIISILIALLKDRTSQRGTLYFTKRILILILIFILVPKLPGVIDQLASIFNSGGSHVPVIPNPNPGVVP